jgi:hypothetical protein
VTATIWVNAVNPEKDHSRPRLQQISAVQAAPRTGTVYTDNNAPVDLAPDRR